ncbi:MAG: glycosyltransferase [Chloroflexi bacterium]|nr:glycosyltransferase [Chloroflexota bacterium]
MRILFLTQIIPYPPDAGPRVKTWHVLRYLVGRGHEVTLASFVRPEELSHVDALTQLGLTVHTVPINRSRVADVGYWLRSHLTRRPFLVERDDLKGMRQLVKRLLAEFDFDAVHADQLTMAQFALDAGGAFTLFDAHNAVWTIWARMRENALWFLKPVYKIEENRIKRHEGMLAEQFDHTMVVIEPDRDALLAGTAVARREEIARRISVIPIAIDTTELQPIQRQADSVNIMTLGSLHYPPNADGIRWFLNEAFPLIRAQIPEATLTVIGKNPPADFVQMAEQNPDAITVTGYVPDLTPYMEAARLMVVPVRAGGGMRVRLLEAFARAMPAVTTTVGLEGIQATHGQEVLVADDPDSFAAETIRLLRDEALQQHLAENGRTLAETRYDWQVVLSQMDAVYDRAGEGS